MKTYLKFYPIQDGNILRFPKKEMMRSLDGIDAHINIHKLSSVWPYALCEIYLSDALPVQDKADLMAELKGLATPYGSVELTENEFKAEIEYKVEHAVEVGTKGMFVTKRDGSGKLIPKARLKPHRIRK